MTARPAVRLGVPDDAEAVAALHASELPDSFLASLGTSFLVRLYRRVARYEGSFLLVIGEGPAIDGFVAVAEHTGGLYREFLVKDGILAGLSALPAVLRAPRRTWETFRYGTGGAVGEDGGGQADGPALPAAEILSVAVVPATRGRGAGRALIREATEELHRRGIAGVRVVAGVDNEPALRMYEASGFTRQATTEVHAGVPQVVLAWS